MEILQRGIKLECLDAVGKILTHFEKSTEADGWPVLFSCQIRVSAVTQELEPIRWNAQKVLRIRDSMRCYRPINASFQERSRR